MKESTLHLLRDPVTGHKFDHVKIDISDEINGVAHIVSGKTIFGNNVYDISNCILKFSSHENQNVYNRMWSDGIKKISLGTENRGVDLKERLLTRLGCKSLGWLEGRSFLDVGCGLGRFSYAAADMGANVIGIDSSSYSLKEVFDWTANSLTPEKFSHCDFIQTDIMDRIFIDGVFDVVFCAHVIHHLKDTRDGLRHISNYVRDRGHLAVTFYDGINYKFPPLTYFLREMFLELPEDLRFRALRKLGIWEVGNEDIVIDVPAAMKKCMEDDDLEEVFTALGLKHALYHENTSTPFMWVQTPDEVEDWIADLGYSIEFNRGCTVVGRRGSPTLREKLRLYIRRKLFSKPYGLHY